MPRYVATIASAWPADRALAYMADFSNAREWDPSVVGATALTGGPVREGSDFELHIRTGRRVADFRYRVVRMEARSVTLRAQTARFISIDTITVREAGSGSELTYDAYLTARGALRLANPLIGVAFRRLGDAARDRLRVVLSR